MYMPIEKQDGNRYYEAIIENVKSMITNGRLKCGEKLPSERDLAEKLQVSRVPVREALKVLEYMGILESRNDGMYVRNVDVGELVDKMNFALTATSKTIIDLLELRIALESTAAYYAALRRTDEDIENLRASLDMIRKLKQSDIHDEEYIQSMRLQSHAFHYNLVQAAKNTVLTSVYKNLYEILEISRQITISTSGISYNSILAHEAIFQRIIDGDCDGAREFMLEHLNATSEKIYNAVGLTGERHPDKDEQTN